MRKSTQINRLQKIVDHLRKEQLRLARFDFSKVINTCGTVGCAMGEFPAIFPRHFYYHTDKVFKKVEVFQRLTNDQVFYVAQSFLGLDNEVFDILFYPNHDAYKIPGLTLKGLPGSATKDEVANNIQVYIDYLKSQP